MDTDRMPQTGMKKSKRVLLRPAEEGDLKYIRDLSGRLFEDYGPYGDMLPDWFRQGAAATFLVMIEDRPAAFAMLGEPWKRGLSPRTSELMAIGVEPGRQRLGLGGLLMTKIEQVARERGIELLVLHTAIENKPGQRLFLRNGFVVAEIRRKFYPKGQDAIMMYKEIEKVKGDQV
jgi:ribosomal protein S18 acetylase RimI-like enzyme